MRLALVVFLMAGLLPFARADRAATTAKTSLNLAKVLSVKQVGGVENDLRTFAVTYVLHCGQQAYGPFSTLLPTRFITEHTHHVVGVMVYDTGRRCLAADQIKTENVKVPVGDVVDHQPLILQP